MMPKPKTFQGTGFRITTLAEDPWMLVIEQGRVKGRFPVVGGVHPLGRWDGLSQPRLVSQKRARGGETWVFEARSSVWKKFRTIWKFDQDSCRVSHEVTGVGNVDVVAYFEVVPAELLPEPRAALPLVRNIRPPLRHYSKPSTYLHSRVFCPQPSAGRPVHRFADEEALLTVACTFGPLEFNTWFSPGLFCYGLLPEKGKGWFLGLGAQPGNNHYHSLRYMGGCGGWGLQAEFDGKVRVIGRWTSPEIELRWAADVEKGLADHVASGRRRGWFPEPAPALSKEWRRPIFCGWGQQQVWCRVAESKGTLPFLDVLVSPAAEAMASEFPYRKMVQLLEKSKLPFGTLTVDAAWSSRMCIPTPDPAKWKDLKGFIAEQHGKNRKVLLWLGCWNPVGLPDSMRMKREEGLKDAIDPALPAFRRELIKGIRHAISPDGLDADGFKLDFTGDIPRGAGYRPHGSLWGVELLLDYVGLIYRTTKAAKSDAVLETHCANPLFADRTDILRLNDIFEDREDIRPMMAHRAAMARIASKEWLIDTDNDPFISAEAWWEYMKFQPEIGIPSLMTITHMARSREPVAKQRLAGLAKIWRGYLRREKIS